jgi:predicted Zn-dependent protease
MAAQATHEWETQLPLMGRQDKDTATPVESIVKPRTLKKTYYYHFAGSVPNDLESTFEQAIAVYNETGIVNLVAGDATERQNGLTIFAYRMTMPKKQAAYLELGKGGPEIETVTGFQGYTANHAQAGLNLTYAQSRQVSVAIHEVGHALGLDHSESRHSVMYPIDQGKTHLSAADIKTLRNLYA